MRLRSKASVLALTGLILSFAPPASAQIVSTSEALSLESTNQQRQLADEYLSREEVAAELEELGVNPELARLRVEALSTAELEALAGRIEEVPAGGGGVITVLGITFLVLLILELVGVIDIFKHT